MTEPPTGEIRFDEDFRALPAGDSEFETGLEDLERAFQVDGRPGAMALDRATARKFATDVEELREHRPLLDPSVAVAAVAPRRADAPESRRHVSSPQAEPPADDDDLSIGFSFAETEPRQTSRGLGLALALRPTEPLSPAEAAPRSVPTALVEPPAVAPVVELPPTVGPIAVADAPVAVPLATVAGPVSALPAAKGQPISLARNFRSMLQDEPVLSPGALDLEQRPDAKAAIDQVIARIVERVLGPAIEEAMRPVVRQELERYESNPLAGRRHGVRPPR